MYIKHNEKNVLYSHESTIKKSKLIIFRLYALIWLFISGMRETHLARVENMQRVRKPCVTRK